MTDSSVRVPEISPNHDGKEVDCNEFVRDGVTYFRQRVEQISHEHQKTHEGRFFSGGYYNGAVANNGTVEVLIQMGTTNTFHSRFSASVSGDSIIELFEGATFSAAGTAFLMSNHNRNSSKVFDGTVTYTPTITATGDKVNGTKYIPAGEKAHASGGGGSFSNEFVLKLSTNYLVRVTNNSGSAAKISVELDGYQPDL